MIRREQVINAAPLSIQKAVPNMDGSGLAKVTGTALAYIPSITELRRYYTSLWHSVQISVPIIKWPHSGDIFSFKKSTICMQ